MAESPLTSFTAGDLVVSISGNGSGTGSYSDNQAAPITLEELQLNGTGTPATIVGSMMLPVNQTTSANGTTEYAISGEYGSSSEGTLELSANGQSLVIAGYGVNPDTYNAGESNGLNTYGNVAEAQSTSVPGGQYTAVPRVVADISANGTVDTSTALYNVYNTQNPRSVATADGSSFYLSGQGVKGSTNQGVFLATDGATTNYSTIYTGVDTRTAELYQGVLYVSSDSSQAKGTGNIASYGPSPTGATTPTPLPGITGQVTLTAGQGNAINNSSGTVDLSPENFFFANPTTLYVADSGNPKGGTAGDGGLQKWTFANNKWNLDYTLSNGLGLVSNGTGDPGSGGKATTGLIGLTGVVTGNSVSLFATNATIGDLNATALYGITDTLSSTAAATSTTESFTQLASAPADSNIRGVAFAPSVACYVSGTMIKTTRGEIAVEQLAVGDLVVTASGDHRPIRWLGHQSHRCEGPVQPRSTWPVRVAAGAFGPRKPSADLFLSPGHSVCVNVITDVLVPIQELVNGSTIAYVEVDEVTYWHIELDLHDVLVANNLPAESFLEMGANRAIFEEGRGLGDPSAEVIGRTHADFCRPFVDGGAVLLALRRQLDERAAALGWQPSRTVAVTASIDGRALAPVVGEGEIVIVLPPEAADEIRLTSSLTNPALLGDSDGRRIGLAVYAIELIDADGATRRLDLDADNLARFFHPGERAELRDYRFTAVEDLVLPLSGAAGLSSPVRLRLSYEQSTLRGWTAPAPAAELLRLRMVA